MDRGQQFPSDVLLLTSSNDDGLAYIATAELDGETNLKRRQSVYTQPHIKNAAVSRRPLLFQSPSRAPRLRPALARPLAPRPLLDPRP